MASSSGAASQDPSLSTEEYLAKHQLNEFLEVSVKGQQDLDTTLCVEGAAAFRSHFSPPLCSGIAHPAQQAV